MNVAPFVDFNFHSRYRNRRPLRNASKYIEHYVHQTYCTSRRNPSPMVKHLPETIKRQELLIKTRARILEYLKKFAKYQITLDEVRSNSVFNPFRSIRNLPSFIREKKNPFGKKKKKGKERKRLLRRRKKGDPQFAATIKGIHRAKNNYHDNDQGLYGFTKRKEMEGSVLRCALSFIARRAPDFDRLPMFIH